MTGLQRLSQSKLSSAKTTSRSAASTSLKPSKHPLLQLQATIGNRSANQWIAAQQQTSRTQQPIQAKPKFQGLAQELMGQSRQGGLLPTPAPSVPMTPPAGKPMPETVQQKMEAAFGTDFSDVRIHEGPEAAAIGALAYTRGSHIYFAPSQYVPASQAGQQLLGHELAHVIQQRMGQVTAPPVQGLPINTSSKLEQEAEALGAKAAQGETVHIAGVRSGVPQSRQNPPLQAAWGRKKVLDKDDKDLQEGPKDLGGGSANAVYKVVYTNFIGDTTSNVGYFKPTFEPLLDHEGYVISQNGQRMDEEGYQLDEKGERIPETHGSEQVKKEIPGDALKQGIWEGDARMSARAVASSRLDKYLKLNVLSDEVFATHTIDGKIKKGSVSADVGGQALNEDLYENVVDSIPTWVKSSEDLKKYKPRSDGKYNVFTRTKLAKLTDKAGNVRDTTQKSLSDLAVLDAITNQTDRHGGNIKYDPTTGRIKGIDNDVAFGKTVEETSDAAFSSTYRMTEVKFKGTRDKAVLLPDLIDQETAKQVLKLKGKNLKKILTDKNPDHEQLSDAEIEATKQRLKAVKNHIKALKKDKLLVGQKGGKYEDGWGKETLSAVMSDKRKNPSYLKHHLDSYNQPRENQVTEEQYNDEQLQQYSSNQIVTNLPSLPDGYGKQEENDADNSKTTIGHKTLEMENPDREDSETERAIWQSFQPRQVFKQGMEGSLSTSQRSFDELEALPLEEQTVEAINTQEEIQSETEPVTNQVSQKVTGNESKPKKWLDPVTLQQVRDQLARQFPASTKTGQRDDQLSHDFAEFFMRRRKV